MREQNSAYFRTHRHNIYRYRRLLETKLSEIERQFIERRLAEEEVALERLTTTAHTLFSEAAR